MKFATVGQMNRCGFVNSRGMTTLELMVALSVTAILVVVAVPSFMKFLSNIRLVTAVNDLISDIVYARNEAATRGKRVSLCASQNVTATNPTCLSAGTTTWATGRIVFLDSDGSGQRVVATDPLLKKVSGLPSGYTLTATGFVDTSHFTFSTYGGLMPSTAGSFKLCAPSNPNGYQLTVATTGQPLSTKVRCP